jgi:hypothetical protein
MKMMPVHPFNTQCNGASVDTTGLVVACGVAICVDDEGGIG